EVSVPGVPSAMVAPRESLLWNRRADDEFGRVERAAAGPPHPNQEFVILASRELCREAGDAIEHFAAESEIGGKETAGIRCAGGGSQESRAGASAARRATPARRRATPLESVRRRPTHPGVCRGAP